MNMNIHQFKPNSIAFGPVFPESVKIMVVVSMGLSIRIIAKGLESVMIHQPVLSSEQVETLVISLASNPYDGAPERYWLGIESIRLGLAYEYDPYFILSIARVDSLPHQLDKVYDYFLKLPRIRYLLADDPGAGKTIMAGLLVKELKVRSLIRGVLIITLANLSFQLQRGIEIRFCKDLTVIRSDLLRANHGSNLWQDLDPVITSITCVSHLEDAKDSLMRTHWDLVIVDEANKFGGYGEDKKTLTYLLGGSLSRMTAQYLLMTATPHKGDLRNLTLFLRMLDPDVYADVKSIHLALQICLGTLSLSIRAEYDIGIFGQP